MSDFDKVFISFMVLACFAIVVVGGLFHPNTIAGSVAKFVFSCN